MEEGYEGTPVHETGDVRDARAEGFRHFHAEMLGGNLRMLQLLRDVLGHDVTTRVQHGVVRVDFEAA